MERRLMVLAAALCYSKAGLEGREKFAVCCNTIGGFCMSDAAVAGEGRQSAELISATFWFTKSRSAWRDLGDVKNSSLSACNLSRSLLPLSPSDSVSLLHAVHDKLGVRDENNKESWDVVNEALAFCHLYRGVRMRVKGDKGCVKEVRSYDHPQRQSKSSLVSLTFVFRFDPQLDTAGKIYRILNVPIQAAAADYQAAMHYRSGSGVDAMRKAMERFGRAREIYGRCLPGCGPELVRVVLDSLKCWEWFEGRGEVQWLKEVSRPSFCRGLSSFDACAGATRS